MKFVFFSLLYCGMLQLPLLAHAESADRDKPLVIQADSLRYDDKNQTSIFSGHVVLTKGTILVRGGKVEVRQDAQGFQYGLVTAETEKLAFFRQKREGVDEYIEGEAQSIDYDGRSDTVKLVGTAQLRRYRASRLDDEFNSQSIVYNNSTQVFQLDAQPAAGARVRAMLTPAPRASGASSAVPLRLTPDLPPAGK